MWSVTVAWTITARAPQVSPKMGRHVGFYDPPKPASVSKLDNETVRTWEPASRPAAGLTLAWCGHSRVQLSRAHRPEGKPAHPRCLCPFPPWCSARCLRARRTPPTTTSRFGRPPPSRSLEPRRCRRPAGSNSARLSACARSTAPQGPRPEAFWPIANRESRRVSADLRTRRLDFGSIIFFRPIRESTRALARHRHGECEIVVAARIAILYIHITPDDEPSPSAPQPNKSPRVRAGRLHHQSPGAVPQAEHPGR